MQVSVVHIYYLHHYALIGCFVVKMSFLADITLELRTRREFASQEFYGVHIAAMLIKGPGPSPASRQSFEI
jgi:uncharacterized membrane protein